MLQKYVDALCMEIDNRGSEGYGKPWDTVYIGGGTPSSLSASQLEQIFEKIDTSMATEITIECNPDDVTTDYARMLGCMPINRVSMGAQTFDDNRLKFLHRRHTSAEVAAAVARLRNAGIGNISVDLMYGFPEETIVDWENDITKALDLDVEHLSAYCLMFEEGTPLYKMMEEGKIAESDEELTRSMYYTLIDRLTEAGYEHYEISNFARSGFRSRHNSSYWSGVSYLGVGASAHSYYKSPIYNKVYRQWNIADLSIYINKVENGVIPMEREELDSAGQYNDMVMLSLRTCEGTDMNLLKNAFGDELHAYYLKCAKPFIDSGLLEHTADSHIRLTRDGLYVSDMVMSELMKI